MLIFAAMNRISRLLVSLLLLTPYSALADSVYQQPDTFIKEVFNGNPPATKVVWLQKDLRARIENILQHKYKGFRIRYWQQDQRSAWILDEIGKEKPITTGIVINNNRIETVRILIFRESRGWEVKHDFFTTQFDDASIDDDTHLNNTIDNISGATLSVRAVSKLARIALLLHKLVTTNN